MLGIGLSPVLESTRRKPPGHEPPPLAKVVGRRAEFGPQSCLRTTSVGAAPVALQGMRQAGHSEAIVPLRGLSGKTSRVAG